MRKRYSILLAGLTAISLVAAACGDDGGDKASTTTAKTGASTCPKSAQKGDPAGKKVGLLFDLAGRGDQSFNDSAACGLDRAAVDFKISPSESTQVTDGDRAERAKALAAKNELVASVGFLWATPIEDAAKANPNVKFSIVDAEVKGPNVYSILFAEEQGSFLVGAAAALQSKSGKIGFIGGVENDLIKKFAAGYVAGAKAAKSSVTVDVKYISPDGDFSGFTSPDKATVIADKQYSGGIDIIYAAAGSSGGGMFKSAKSYTDKNGKDKKVWGIGVDSDQYLTVGADLQPYVLTSMLKRVDNAVYDAIKQFVGGTFPGGTTGTFDLAKGGVGYATSGGFLTADTIKKLDDYKQQIIDKKIVVPAK
jgi:basic membrane protein A